MKKKNIAEKTLENKKFPIIALRMQIDVSFLLYSLFTWFKF